MKEIEKIISGIYNDVELRKTCIPLFISNPGLGKTTIIRKYFESINKKCLTVIASTKMPHEFSGISIPDHSSKRMTYFDYDDLVDLKDGDCLFLDEILNASPMILAAFLTVLEDRVLPSGTKLADIIIVAAANPQFSNPMSPQIKERFIWYDVEFDPKLWANYMYEKYGLIDPIIDQLIELIKNESFTSANKNYYTPRSIDKAINMCIKNVATPYQTVFNCLQHYITNPTDQDISIGDYTWKVNEKITWLKLKQLENDKVNTK